MTLAGRHIAPIVTARSIGEARERARALGQDILGVAYERSWTDQGVLEVGDPIPLHVHRAGSSQPGRSPMKRIAIAVAFALALLVAAPTAAARPGGTGTLAVNEVDLNWGESVTFTVTATSSPTYVYIECSQAGQVVGVGFTDFGYSASYVTDTTGLYSPAWPSGGASCTATLEVVLDGIPRTRIRDLDTIAFAVGP